MVNGLHLYSAFIQSALQFLPLIHPFTHTFTHQRRLAAMQGTNQLVRSNRGLGVLLRDTSTRPGWDRTGNLPTAWRQLYLLSHIAPSHIAPLTSSSCVVLGWSLTFLIIIDIPWGEILRGAPDRGRLAVTLCFFHFLIIDPTVVNFSPSCLLIFL